MTLAEAARLTKSRWLERPLAACPECGAAVLRTQTTQQRVCSRPGCGWWAAAGESELAGRVRAALKKGTRP